MHPLMDEDFNEDDLRTMSNDPEIGLIRSSPSDKSEDLLVSGNLIEFSSRQK